MVLSKYKARDQNGRDLVQTKRDAQGALILSTLVMIDQMPEEIPQRHQRFCGTSGRSHERGETTIRSEHSDRKSI